MIESDEIAQMKTDNAFDVLMSAPQDKEDAVVFAVVYIRWLRWIDKSSPLYNIPYIGQVVRAQPNSVEDAVKARWREENAEAIRKDTMYGLLAALDCFGPSAFYNEVFEWRHGPRSEVQEWANECETALIKKHGGPLRDAFSRLHQTLNLTHGGKRATIGLAKDASRSVLFHKFFTEIKLYVESKKTALVPTAFVTSSNYKLGIKLKRVRAGAFWKGHSHEAKFKAMLESLPRWSWNATTSEDWKANLSKTQTKRFENASEEVKQNWKQSIKAGCNTPEYLANLSTRMTNMWDEEGRRAAQSERSRSWWATSTPEQQKTMEDHRSKTVDKKREERFSKLSEKELASAHSRIEINKRSGKNRKSLLGALRKLPGWEKSRNEDVAKARKLGLLLEVEQDAKKEQQERQKIAYAAKQKTRLNGLSKKERAKAVVKTGINKRSGERRKMQLLALRKVPGWEKAHNRDIPKARKAGVLPDVDH